MKNNHPYNRRYTNATQKATVKWDRWQDWEIKILLDNLNKPSYEVALLLHRTTCSVQGKIRRMKLKRTLKDAVSIRSDDIKYEVFKDGKHIFLSLKEICKILKSRSYTITLM